LKSLNIKGDYFRFGSVFIKKSNQTEFVFFLKKPQLNRKWFKLTEFSFLEQKPVQTGLAGLGSVLARFFPVWFCFSGLARFFWFDSVLFSGFFRFQAYKTKTEPNQSVFLKF
jgi:hypothetical protein